MLLKKLSSFLFIRKVESTSSTKNPVLEIELLNGKYILNARNVNYAFGSLDKVWKDAFRKTELKKRNIKHVLILGLGPGNIATILNGKGDRYKITGVEWDEEVIRLGKKYFGLGKIHNLEIVNENAIDFVKNCKEIFDLICVDLFLDEIIPKEAEGEVFLHQLALLLSPGGLLLYNRLMFTASLAEKSRDFTSLMKKFLPGSTSIEAGGNRVIVFEKKI